MGRHARRTNSNPARFGGYLKGCLLFLVLVSLVGGLTAYGYVKYLESRLHKGNAEFEAAQKLISEPPPNKPINFLLLGSDFRPKEGARSDTIMIAHVDLKKKKAVLISIPRDMRVEIPGRKGYDKINAAYAFGGVPLAVRTIESYTDLPINHYAVTDFNGFKKMVNALGGVEVNVTHPVNSKERGYKMFIPAGPQVLNGEVALNYCRFRHDAQGDFGRIKRQQEFIGALADKMMSVSSVLKLPQLINIFTANTTTDMDAEEIFKLAYFARSLKKEDVEMVSLPGVPKSINGISYVIGDDKKISEILEAVKEGRSIGEPKKASTSTIPNSQINVKILNGCGIAGVAEKAKAKLTSEGFIISAAGNANNFNYQKTVILYRSDEGYAKALKVKKYFSDSVLQASSTGLGLHIDVTVIIGKSYANS